MSFASPHMAVWLWLLPVIYLLFVLFLRARQRAMERFARGSVLSEIAYSFDLKKRKAKDLLLLLSFAFMLFALLRPQWGFEWKEIRRRGVDIIIALDTSNSMLAEDVKPNRIRRSKLAIIDFVKNLRGDRVGLIAFAGTAVTQSPLTLDYNGFLISLGDVDTYTVPVGGTSLASAIDRAIEMFDDSGVGERVLILITDGEDFGGGLDRAVERARANEIKIFAVGVGSPEGELIPVPDDRGKSGFLRDRDGELVKTRLNELTLQKIAVQTGGMYVRASGAGFGLDAIYEEKISKFQQQEFKAVMEKKYHERFQIPLVLAFLILLIEPLAGDRKNPRKEAHGRPAEAEVSGKKPSRTARKAIPLILTVFLISSPETVFAFGERGRAARLFRQERYDEALEMYNDALEKRPRDPVLEYNRAVVLYRKGDMGSARESFLRAGVFGDSDVEIRSLYNIGNTKFRMAESLPEPSLDLYTDALEYYKKAIRLDPEDIDAKYNYEFVLNRIAELEDREQSPDREEDQQEEDDREDEGSDSQDGEQGDPGDDDSPDRDQGRDDGDGEKDDSRESEQTDAGEDDKKDPEKRQEPSEEEPDIEEREPSPGVEEYIEPSRIDPSSSDLDHTPGEMSQQQALSLLRIQEEEENRMRRDKREAEFRERSPVEIDW